MASLDVWTYTPDLDGSPHLMERLGALRMEADKAIEQMHRKAVGWVPFLQRMPDFGFKFKYDIIRRCGFHLRVDLTPQQSFADLHEVYDYLRGAQLQLAELNRVETPKEPDPDDYPELYRREWAFVAGHSMLTLAAFSSPSSIHCKLVPTGETKPVYRLDCEP